MRMLDTFAGAGGWDLGARAHGITDIDRVEIWAPANATAAAAGFAPPVAEDVRRYHVKPGVHDIQTHSPSCRAFAICGKGEGRAQLDRILAAVRNMGAGSQMVTMGIHPDAALTLEPLRLILEGEPRAVACEQAPSVLPIWQAYAEVLQQHGYATWAGIVDAADFDVPQQRKRAVLLARRDRAEVLLPILVTPAVTMAEALSWGMTHRPAYTITGGGTYTGGAEPWGNAARKGMRREYDAGRWIGEWRARPVHEEAARLQTFPDGYPFQGNQGQRFQQIGNAVPPMLAKALIGALL
jgi:DNA (cytosine-5)-methyltransferase 1